MWCLLGKMYSASLFKTLNGLGYALSFNILNKICFIDYFPIITAWPMILPLLTHKALFYKLRDDSYYKITPKGRYECYMYPTKRHISVFGLDMTYFNTS